MTFIRCRNEIGLFTGGLADTVFTRAALQAFIPHGYEVRDVTTHDILYNGVLDPKKTKLAALFICGNREGQRYRDELGEAGKEAIQLYALRGGIVIGICAGGYILWEIVDYESPRKKHITRDNLAMIKGTAYGQLPLLLPDTHHLNGWFHANTTKLHLINQGCDTELMYWGGARFCLDPSEKATVHAVYTDPVMAAWPNAAAVISKRYGDGYVTALGIHAEISATALAHLPYAAQLDTDDGTHRCNLITTLEKYERVNAALWDEVVVRPILLQPNRLGERKPKPVPSS